MSTLDTWNEAQAWEKNWWLNARAQHSSEILKTSYVARLLFIDRGLPDKSVIDIGCGPLSLLLRVPVRSGVALDPINFEDLEGAYTQRGIKRLLKTGEALSDEDGHFDEAWIYNCLQHVQDPSEVLTSAMAVADTVRLFEWIGIPPYPGHLHELTAELLFKPFRAADWHVAMETTGYLDYGILGAGRYAAGIYQRVKT
jgi:hypothetical protein